jgi:hypothetical protein
MMNIEAILAAFGVLIGVLILVNVWLITISMRLMRDMDQHNKRRIELNDKYWELKGGIQ